MESKTLEVVFLDIGNTLIVDAGEAGAMVDWLRLDAVEGAQDMLRALHPRYRVIIATNAGDSNAERVRAALARVGLAVHVDDVVSSCDIGATKPSLDFYREALRVAGNGGPALAPGRAVMVGDSWPNDVAGAQAAGLQAVWFNPSHQPAPEAETAADAEIERLVDLPAAIARLEAGC